MHATPNAGWLACLFRFRNLNFKLEITTTNDELQVIEITHVKNGTPRAVSNDRQQPEVSPPSARAAALFFAYRSRPFADLWPN